MLIDTGFGLMSLAKVVGEITNKPIVLVNTHGHPDHVGGNAEFGRPYLHPLDNDLYARASTNEARMKEATAGWKFWEGEIVLQPTPEEPIPMEDGDVFDLGGRELEVILTPGHTQGSVCIYDRQTGRLFAADTVQKTPAGLVEPCATNVSTYMASLEKLMYYKITAVSPGHFDHDIPADMIGKKIKCCQKILNGEQGTLKKTWSGEFLEMSFEDAAIDYREDLAN